MDADQCRQRLDTLFECKQPGLRLDGAMISDSPGRSDTSDPLTLSAAPMKRLMSFSGIWSMAASLGIRQRQPHDQRFAKLLQPSLSRY
jgi:hypothetical protein